MNDTHGKYESKEVETPISISKICVLSAILIDTLPIITVMKTRAIAIQTEIIAICPISFLSSPQTKDWFFKEKDTMKLAVVL